MQFNDLAHRRRSIRKFAHRPVEEEKLRAVLDAANAAPSAGNLQACEIVRVSRTATRRALMRAALDQEMVEEAPVVLVFFASPSRSARKYGSRGESLYSLQDATIACTYAQLAAADLGLGSVWVGAFDEEAVAKALAAPAGLRPVAILPLGVPAESPEPSPRRPIREMVHDETF